MVITYSESEDTEPLDSGYFDDDEIAPSVEQLAILCIDSSRSMRNPQGSDAQWTRSHEVFRHLFSDRGLIERLQASELRRSFWTMALTFDEEAVDIYAPTRLVSQDGRAMRLAPRSLEDLPQMMRWRGQTSIASALVRAAAAANVWLGTGSLPRFVTIAIISDGGDNDARNSCRHIAREIKYRAARVDLGPAGISRPDTVIACAAYGQDAVGEANWDVLREIATDQMQFFRAVRDGEQLRDFLIASFTLPSRS